MTKIDSILRKLISALKPWQKTYVVFLADFLIAAIAIYASFYIRISSFDFVAFSKSSFHISILLMIAVQSVSFYKMGLYKGIWRYSSTPDLLRLIKGVTLAVILSFICSFFYNRLDDVYRTVFFIDWLLLIVLLGGIRFAYRMWRDQFAKSTARNRGDKVIIVGAGDGGDKLFREMKNSPNFDVNVVAFIDDDLGKRNKSLHGIPIMGGISDISQVVEQTQANNIFIAIPSATDKQFRRIIKECENTKLEIKTLPNMKDILNKSEDSVKLRDVRPEDLLGREEVQLDKETLGSMIANKTILVTGAGGSIGSELCRQIANFEPKQLILFEVTEFFLYSLEMQLTTMFPHIDIVSIIGDIRCREKVEQVLAEHSPEVVFHAAAYKHVPMMEKNPHEAIKTNIFGTKVITELSRKHNVERFVLISTDKAVNPTNIMGTTKRIAEMIVQDNQEKSKKTKFMVVRFGNVLGSSGSVIPLFKKQIKNGGPLTVTHPEITRYFMSIPEAAQLVLQAGSIGNGGEIFVLDMGKPFKIVNLAKQLITLAGLRIEEDIEIKYTGLRPGEKLYEELLADQESTLPTIHPKVRIAKARKANQSLENFLISFEKLIKDDDPIKTSKVLKEIVPEFTHNTEGRP